MKVIIDTEQKSVTPVAAISIMELNSLLSKVAGKEYGSWTILPYIETEVVYPECKSHEYPITPCQTSTTL